MKTGKIGRLNYAAQRAGPLIPQPLLPRQSPGEKGRDVLCGAVKDSQDEGLLPDARMAPNFQNIRRSQNTSNAQVDLVR